MKDRISHFFTAIGIFLCIFSWTAKGLWASPQIHFDHITFDFGRVIQGQKVSHVFEFKNIGDETLNIKNVKAG
jgi:hypothetical protein